MNNKLCCTLQPRYNCEACGFQECNHCFNVRLASPSESRSFHILGLDSDAICAETKIDLFPERKNGMPLSVYTQWSVKKKTQ